MKYLVEDSRRRKGRAVFSPVDRLEVLMFAELHLRRVNANCCRENEKQHNRFNTRSVISDANIQIYDPNLTPVAADLLNSDHFRVLQNSWCCFELLSDTFWGLDLHK